ncbi:hypothetical protein ACOSQ2_031699 [Xanthoceras sorbifolium]
MGRLKVMRCPVAKRGANATPFATLPKRAKVGDPNRGGQALVSGGPPPFFPPPPFVSFANNHRKMNEVAFDASTKQPVRRGYLLTSPRAPTLYEEFLTGGLSQRIKEGKGMDLRHTLLRHTIMLASLAYKHMFDAKRNEAERMKLCNELMKAKKELAARTGHEK